jgi:hypothetical protein
VAIAKGIMSLVEGRNFSEKRKTTRYFPIIIKTEVHDINQTELQINIFGEILFWVANPLKSESVNALDSFTMGDVSVTIRV